MAYIDKYGVEFSDDRKTLLGCPSSLQGEYVIPNCVTSIGERPFFGCKDLTSVTIPNNVKSIGENAFSHCSNLTKVTICSNIIVSKKYDSSSICSIFGAQVNEYIIGNDINQIGEYAFYGCKNLTSVKIGNSVTSIEHAAFSGCSNIKSVNIPNSVTSIGSEAFYSSGLTSIKISSSVTSIGWSAFSGCSSLKSIEIPSSIVSIENYTFHGCSNLKSIIIPDSVTSIGDEVFKSCRSLVSIVIPDSVTKIGYGNFCDCEKLRSIVIGNGIKHIDNCFKYCNSLSSIVCTEDLRISQKENYIQETKWFSLQPMGAITLGATLIAYIPSDDETLEHYKVPDNILYIAADAFEYCDGMESIDFNNVQVVDCDLPDSISTIMASGDALLETESFENTTWYKKQKEGCVYMGKLLYGYKKISNYPKVIKLNEQTQVINKRAFYNEVENDDVYCSRKDSFVVIGNKNLTIIGESAFEGAPIKEIVASPHLWEIRKRAFFRSKLNAINMPYGLQVLGEYAFAYCELRCISIPPSISIIPEGAFMECNVSSIYIPHTVKGIGYKAFYNNSALENVFLSERVETIGDDAFAASNAISGFPCLMIPSTIKSLGNAFARYRHEEYYDERYSSYRCDKNEVEVLIVGCDVNTHRWASYFGTKLKTVIFKEGVTAIPSYCFLDCAVLKNVILPTSLHTIMEGVFQGCESLETLTLPQNIKEIWSSSLPQNIKKVIVSSGQLLLKIGAYGKERYNYYIENNVFVDANGSSIIPKLMIYKLGNRNDNGVHCYRGNLYDIEVVEDFENPEPKDEDVSDGYANPSYSQYGGYNGYDDDTIDSAFEGDPEATWNVD